MSISIIGGSGFLGRVLSKNFLKSGLSFRVYDLKSPKEDYSFSKCDVTNKKTLDCIKDSSILINLAAEHKDNVQPISKYDFVNIQGAKNLCEIAREKKIKTIIFLSSVAIYGFADPNTDEDGSPNYFNDYGRTKHLAEKEYIKWYRESPNERNLIIIRPTVIFGEGNRGNVYNLIEQIAKKRFIMFGDGLNSKSMAYVENVADFIQYVIERNIKGFKKFNYVDKPDLTMNKLTILVRKILFQKNNVGLRMPKIFGILIGKFADIIMFITKKELPVSSIRVKKFMGTTTFSSAVSKTGFIPRYSLEEGLHRTINSDFLHYKKV